MSDFAKGIEAYAKRTKLGIDQAIVSINTQAAVSIIKRTPVDTGRARGNWQPSISIPNKTTTETNDKSGSASIASARATAKVSAGAVFYLTNNLPYIRTLEHGWYNGNGPKTTPDGYSTQAPNGMVGLTVLEMRARIIKEWKAK